VNNPFKGILHPKIKILSLLTLKLLQTCRSFFLLLNTKEDRTIGNLPPLISIVFFFYYMEVNGAKQLFGSNRSSKYLTEKKLIQVCNNLREFSFVGGVSL